MTDRQITILYHSGYGHTEQQAKAVRDGALSVPGVKVLFLSVDEVDGHWEDIAQSTAIIFGAPTYMGTVSAQFKAFMDQTSSTVLAPGFLWKDKLAAGFTTSASRAGDKQTTLIALATFAAQMGMHWLSLGLPPANNSSTGSEDDLNRLGFFSGAAAQANADEGPDIAPPRADLLTAEHLGRRVAETALRYDLPQSADAA